MKEITRHRSRLQILSHLLAFPTINQKDWKSGCVENNANIGDLVSLVSAPASKWYVSWVRDISENNGWPKWLLESIEDGELCWWSNVGLNIFNRETVKNNPHWKWDDNQYKFSDRWYKVCRRNDEYIVRPMSPVFGDDYSVTLNVRIKFGMPDYHNPETFTDYRKTTMNLMDGYYKKCVSEYNSELNRKKLSDSPT